MTHNYYYAIMLLILVTLLTIPYASSTIVSFTVVGHLKKWKEIQYPKYFKSMISRIHFGYDLLSDCKTHPQCMMLLGFELASFLIFCYEHINVLFVWILDVLLFLLKFSKMVFLYFYAKRLFNKNKNSLTWAIRSFTYLYTCAHLNVEMFIYLVYCYS